MDAPSSLRESLKRVAVILKEAGIPFALGGSYACWARGGPEPVHDVDFMLREVDVPRAVEVLAAAGLRPVDPPEDWLTKVYDGDILVDLIHHPVGRAVTTEMLRRSSEMSVDSVRMPVLDATDWFEMTLLALDERYCDLGRVIPMIRAMREQVDWEQVRRATAESPFAEAALLIATRLNLIPPPAQEQPQEGRARQGRVAEAMGMSARRFGPGPAGPGPEGPVGRPAGEAAPAAPPGPAAMPAAMAERGLEEGSLEEEGFAEGALPAARPAAPAPTGAIDPRKAAEYLAGDLHERLGEDPRVAELGLIVAVEGERITVRGEVATVERRAAVDDVLAEAAPGLLIRNDVRVTGRRTPLAPEKAETLP